VTLHRVGCLGKGHPDELSPFSLGSGFTWLKASLKCRADVLPYRISVRAEVSGDAPNPFQAAEMLNLSAYTIRAYARQGIIPAHKIGRTWRFSKADLDDWVLSDGRSPSLERRDVVIARDRASSAMFSPIPAATSGYGEADAVNERSRAIRTLRDIRARTRKGSATALIRDSRKELQDRGHIDRSDA
jgi:excisionase family DNA binding protein